MKSPTQTPRRTPSPARPRPRRAVHATAREARRQRSFDGVLASYIRELAVAADPTAGARSGGENAVRDSV